MPSKIRPTDWDRLFAPNAPRRAGPLTVLINMILLSAIFGVIGFGGVYGTRFIKEQRSSQSATATSVVATSQAQFTATAEVRQATRTAEAMPSATPLLPVGTVTNGGNLRSEPRVAPQTVVGLIFPGDTVIFLEERNVAGQLWRRVRVTTQADARGVAPGTEGWASATLLSAPVVPSAPAETPLPVDTPTPTGPLGALQPVTHEPSGVSLYVPQAWAPAENQGETTFGWRAPDGTGQLVGEVIPLPERSGTSAALATNNWIPKTATRIANVPELANVTTEVSNPDGSASGTLSIGQLRGRYRTFVATKGLICVMILVPADRFEQLDGALKQLIDAAQAP